MGVGFKCPDSVLARAGVLGPLPELGQPGPIELVSDIWVAGAVLGPGLFQDGAIYCVLAAGLALARELGEFAPDVVLVLFLLGFGVAVCSIAI